MAWGLEARVPFLDTRFLDVALSEIPSILKMPSGDRSEKWILRKSFENGYLPEEILWRQKEQFSDGVGYSWIDGVKEHASMSVTDEEFSRASDIYPHDTPTTKEAFYYRKIFTSFFPGDKCLESVVRWIPRTDWGTS